MTDRDRERARSRRAAWEAPGWEYLAGVPQDPEYPFHGLRWKQWAGREELSLEEWVEAREAADVLRLTGRLARDRRRLRVRQEGDAWENPTMK